MFHLVVTRAFGHYAVGVRITDPQEVERILAENASSVVKVAIQSAPPES